MALKILTPANGQAKLRSSRVLAAVTSQVRFAGRDDSGFFRVVDLDTGETLVTEPVPGEPVAKRRPEPARRPAPAPRAFPFVANG